MKQNLVIVAVLAVLIAATVLVTEHERETAMDSLLRELEAHLAAGAWGEAHRSLARLTDQWNRGRFWLALANTGEDINEFERYLAQVAVYIDVEDRTLGLAAVADLKSIWRRLERS